MQHRISRYGSMAGTIISLSMGWYDVVMFYNTVHWAFFVMALVWFQLNRAFLQECKE